MSGGLAGHGAIEEGLNIRWIGVSAKQAVRMMTTIFRTESVLEACNPRLESGWDLSSQRV